MSENRTFEDLIRSKRVLVCCGAGGVGKTTVAASIGLAVARLGLRVLVITIDPSRRLAETLGVSGNPTEPVEVTSLGTDSLPIRPPGKLSAWILDPQGVADRAVRTLSPDGETAHALLKNRMYRNMTAMIAGMQEYTAVEALHDFVMDDRYDLVILDTPPSRNALRFLDPPSRAATFLDLRVFKLFIPGGENVIRQAASKIIEKVLDLGFGRETRIEIQTFLQLFEGILVRLNRNQAEMAQFFSSSDVSFLLVTSPAREALTEAYFFEGRTRELGLHVGGFVLNRSHAWAHELPMPDTSVLPPDAPPEARTAFKKLSLLAKPEAQRSRDHALIVKELQQRLADDQGILWVLPDLPAGASELDALLSLARHLAEV